MEVLASGSERELLHWRDLGRGPLALTLAVLLLVVGQTYALTRDRSLPPDVRITVVEGGYVVGTLDMPSLVTFQLSHRGPPVQVRAIDLQAPGLRLTDLAVSGESVGARRVGDGPDPVPRFTLDGGATIIMTFAATDCAAIDSLLYPVQLDLALGYRREVVELRLRDYPNLTGNGGPDIPWQQVLASALCL